MLSDDPRNKVWHVRHDDEIWTDDDDYIACGHDEVMAHYIVDMHNAALGLTPTQKIKTRMELRAERRKKP